MSLRERKEAPESVILILTNACRCGRIPDYGARPGPAQDGAAAACGDDANLT